MWIRRTIALLALVNVLEATYLSLWKRGLVGALACTEGKGCEIAQFSQWGWFVGVDVAVIGAFGYLVILLVALWGSSTPALAQATVPTLALAALVGPAFLFTLRLKYAEFVILKTFCPWCAISAVTMTLFLVLVWRDWVRVRPGASATA